MKLFLQLVVLLFTFATLINGQYVQINYYGNPGNNSACKSGLISGAYAVENTCYDGSIAQCNSDGTVQLATYENSYCTGPIVSTYVQPSGDCVDGVMLTCGVSEYDLPQNTYITIASSSCNWKSDFIYLLYRPINTCFAEYNQNSSLISCTSSEVTWNTYNSDNGCSGNPKTTTTQIDGCDFNNFDNFYYNDICNN